MHCWKALDTVIPPTCKTCKVQKQSRRLQCLHLLPYNSKNSAQSQPLLILFLIYFNFFFFCCPWRRVRIWKYNKSRSKVQLEIFFISLLYLSVFFKLSLTCITFETKIRMRKSEKNKTLTNIQNSDFILIWT